MNLVYVSPHFPYNFIAFAERLNALGVNVLGLADESYDNLRPELKGALREYYRVDNMHNYDSLVRALGYFTHGYGKIDRLESHNEYWLETDARLRTDFNIHGLKLDTILHIKRKSLMKERYRNAGLAVARGCVVHSEAEALRLIAETGYPVVAKPDIGVGAARTYKIHNEKELADFFASKPGMDYIMEEFVQGTVCSFDGLADRDGKIVFYTSHVFSEGIMEVVNQDDTLYYYSLRDIPPDLEDAGRRTVKAFDVRERFFHLEFFRRHSDNRLVALEVNMRPPGGMTADMFNYANDIDVYAEWANLVVFNQFKAIYTRPYHCGYVGRKNNRSYAHSHNEILNRYGHGVCHHDAISGVFSAAMGNDGYLVRSPELEEVLAMTKFIQETV
ncbi:MAG: ATP-grasp domain-containing protein [Fibrobacterota bacterium]